MQPGEFWDMTLPEFFAEVNAAAEKSPPGAKLTDEDRDRFSEWLKGGEA